MNSGQKKPMRKSWLRRVLRAILAMLVVWLVVTWLVVLVLRFVAPPTSAYMIESRFAAWRAGDNHYALRYHWVAWENVSSALPISLVASEDQKFPFHHGFDVAAIRLAIDEAEGGDRLRGASTISQQTAKNLFLWGGRSFVRKGFEAYFTVLLETTWSKRRILEVYMNIAQFGDGIYGADAAARTFFHESPAQLSPHQAALLAAVLPNPLRLHAAQPSAYVERRADWIERQVGQLGGAAYLPH